MTESSYRRIPVYILADTSSSMEGDSIEALNNGLKALKEELMRNPDAIESGFVSLITFGGENARVVCPLTEIKDFKPPTLVASGLTPFGDAMKKLNEAIDKEVRIRDANYKSDYKSIVFVFTDGNPTDDGWREAVETLRERQDRKVATIITLGCGSAANEEVIKFISNREKDLAIKSEELSPTIISAYFKAISQSMGNVAEHGVLDRGIFEEELEDVKIL